MLLGNIIILIIMGLSILCLVLFAIVSIMAIKALKIYIEKNPTNLSLNNFKNELKHLPKAEFKE